MRGGLSFLLLVAVYALTLASAHPLDLLAGALVAAAILIALRRFLFTLEPLPGSSLARRVIAFPRFALAVLWQVALGTWQVGLVVVGRRPLSRPGIVAIPVGERTGAGVAASALAVTLSPGEVLVDVDWERGLMLLHVLDASDPDALRRHHARLYERYQRSVFP